MKEFMLRGTQEFMGKSIPVVYGGFGENQKCISDKTVAELHNINTFKVRERIKDNIKRFKESIDFIDLKQRICDTDTLKLLVNMGYAKQSITQAEHIYILSRRGYAKMIKIFDTDLAWEIYENLLDRYFYMEENNSYNIAKCIDDMDDMKERISILEENMTIDYGQQNVLKNMVTEVVLKTLGGYESNSYRFLSKKLYSLLWKDYKNQFQLNSYINTPQVKYNDAKKFISNWVPEDSVRHAIISVNNAKDTNTILHICNKYM